MDGVIPPLSRISQCVHRDKITFYVIFTTRQRKLSWTHCGFSLMCVNTMGTPIGVSDIVTELITNNAIIMHF